MSIRVQATSDLVRTESTARVISDPASLQCVPRVERDADLEQLWKEETLKEEPSRLEVESAVESINNDMEHINRALRFAVHEDTQRLMVRVVNVLTDEVIKEVPPEEVLDTVARIREMIGLLIDERA